MFAREAADSIKIGADASDIRLIEPGCRGKHPATLASGFKVQEAVVAGGKTGIGRRAVNDFRKLAGMEAYAPTDNVSELTARINDDGWSSVFAEWLKGSRLNGKDAILVLSVGGGSQNVSPNLVSALQLAKERSSAILGIVGRDGGYTAQVADVAIVIPTVNPANVTPHTEAFQAVVWHLWISHPDLKIAQTKWESMK